MQFSKHALDFSGQFKELRKTQNLCICGLLIALYVVISAFNLRLSDTIEIRFGFLAFVAAGMYGGPVMGIMVGSIGDVLNCLVRGFALAPGFTLSYALVGMGCGLIMYRRPVTKLRAVGCALVEYLTAITINTYTLYLMYGTEIHVLFTTRLFKCTANFFVNIILVYVFLEAFQKVMHAAVPVKR